MDLQRLRIFVAVADAKGFSKAARVLSLGQSAVSRQVQVFEEEVGLILFRRNGRGVTLTDHGVFVLERSKQILDNVAEFDQELQQLSGAPSGLVSVALPPTLGPVLLGPLIQSVEKTHPLIRMRFTEGFSSQINDLLEQSALDIALIYDSPRKRIFATEQLFDEELFLIGPPGCDEAGDVSLAEVSRLPLILPTRSHRIALDEAIAAMGLKLNVRFEIDSVTTAQEMVREGLGYAIQPSASVFWPLQRGDLSLRRFEGARFRRPVVLAYASDRRISRATMVVSAAIKTTFATLFKSGYWLDHIPAKSALETIS